MSSSSMCPKLYREEGRSKLKRELKAEEPPLISVLIKGGSLLSQIPTL